MRAFDLRARALTGPGERLDELELLGLNILQSPVISASAPTP